MTWTDEKLNAAEEAVVKLSETTDLTDKGIVDVIVDGLAMKYKGKLPDNLYVLVDELRATFDVY